jgi:hypothetical protein
MQIVIQSALVAAWTLYVLALLMRRPDAGTKR